MAFTNALLHPMLTTAGQTAVSASLHTADPGSTGAAEVPSSDGYARQAVSWQTPADGKLQADGDLTFSVPSLGSGKVTHVGLWNANDEFLIGVPAEVPQPYPTPGTATVGTLVLDMSTGVLVAQINAE